MIFCPANRFDKPVYIDDSNILVPENVPIREKDLQRLEKWNITKVITEGRVIATDIEESAPDSFLQQALKTPETREIIKTYNDLRGQLSKIHEQVRVQDPVDTNEIDAIIDRVLQLLDHHRPKVIEFILYGFQGRAGIVENALNCAFLSVLVGQQLNMAKHKLLHLATAALLHDIGMHRLPSRILNKEGKLSPEEAQLVRTHPIHSYKITTREMKYPEEVGVAALQHQERWDAEDTDDDWVDLYPTRRLTPQQEADRTVLVSMATSQRREDRVYVVTEMERLVGAGGWDVSTPYAHEVLAHIVLAPQQRATRPLHTPTDPALRSRGVQLLAQLGGRRSEALLRQVLRYEQDAAVRAQAVAAVGSLRVELDRELADLLILSIQRELSGAPDDRFVWAIYETVYLLDGVGVGVNDPDLFSALFDLVERVGRREQREEGYRLLKHLAET